MKILWVVYDNGSYISWFPQGVAYLASACRNAGHEVKIYNQDVYHWPDEHLTEYLDNEKFDVVGVSVIAGYYQYRKLFKLADAINKSKNRPFFMIGGHGPAPEPEFFLKKTGADVVGIGEGEITVVELLDALENRKSLHTVNGIAYLENGKLVKTPERELIENIDDIDFPAYDLFPMDHYTLLRMPHINADERCVPILSGRGCTFKCNFCFRLDKGFRPRSPENIIEEIKLLKKNYNVSYIAFSDELLMSSVERTMELCEKIIEANLNIKWDCNGRLNYAKPEVLEMMKKAGCVFINYGIESMDEQALKNMNKALTTKQIVEGIENTLKSGISPGYNIIFGNIGETKKSLELGVEFLLKYDDHSQLRTIRPVTPYPGSPLYYYAIEKGLLKDCEDFYENKHLNSDLLAVNFTDMSDEEFHRALYDANTRLMKNYFEAKCNQSIEIAKKLYIDRNTSFRGFRTT
ncbi:radical SAM protein [Wukongibacter baidiensis]|uniref:B12-binding domain-containing radical SAM protein n=1 Tax=Wukongibacter baidiensis TaxID=1723361 RepID=UPI003D7FA345